MTVEWITALLDTPPSTSVGADVFWLQATGTRPSTRRGPKHQFATLLPQEGDAYLRTQVIESEPSGIHLDLHVPDPGEAATRAMSLGATAVADHGTLVVLTSPGGLRFCLVAHRGEHLRPRPTPWPPGHHSLVDQVCLDIPADDFDLEARFWSAVTGWNPHRGSRPEFDYLDRPNTIALRVLLQRVRSDGPVRAHLDLATDDVRAETARHQALGATVIRRTDLWTTLRDPSSREYCITRRDPWSGQLNSHEGAL